jgi:Zn-dependent protease
MEWIVVAALEGFARKNLSRDIDAFGGIVFITVGVTWLLAVFPFEFAHFADVMPDFLRFLVQWISNDIARVIMVLVMVAHLFAAVYYGILRVLVRKARASASARTDMNEEKRHKLEEFL